ncbi:glycosyltransferase family 2 protein [Brachyspira sp. G79]|uniref:glycosyltransferase family 2 protein n=1 Tax=Brachyspira sp. G79 TaxID=1358104 RepID=UPI000BBCD577|nr:glycosyltransferase family 2 protein [Brachyspira sp. G79]PCG20633.1 dolichol monophosphate mannose synthase [Brachyspira sp. G79]
MKTISIVIPTYNEEGNVIPLSEKLISIFNDKLSNYNYEIIFIDNYSKDNTRKNLLELCSKNKNIKAIFNAKNFGQLNSPFYGLLQSSGDCTILLCADFQDPPDLIVDFIREWENGYKIVIGRKNKSKENPIMYIIRTIYYNLIKRISSTEHISHFTGFGLYDKDFINVLRNLEDSEPYLRGIVAELGYTRKEIFYEQQKRKAGKTKNNFYSLYDVAMLGITSYSKVVLRLATMFGFLFSILSFLSGIVYFIYKLIYWDRFVTGIGPLILGVFFIGSIQLFFIGLLGEYILNINLRVMKRPLVVEERRINFD